MPIPTFTGMGPHPDFDAVVRKVNTLVQELTNLMLNLDDANFDKITANVLDVNELSAITANMGKLTSGQIFGAYIATKEAAYPRAEMSNTNDLFGAFGTASNYVTIKAVGSSIVPEMEFVNGVKAALIRITSTLFLIQATSDFALATSGSMDLSAANVTVNGVNVNSGLASNMAFDPATRNLKLFAPNGNTIATVNIP